jgi:peptidyl-tRNA hydrolase
MRKGKMIAQGAHASMKVILDQMETNGCGCCGDGTVYNEKTKELVNYGFIKSGKERHLRLWNDTPLYEWLEGKFTKIVVSVNSEQELLEVYEKAKNDNILCSLIEDSGATEFKGIPTHTCCAIGPDESEKIDKITGHLSLL